MDTLTVKGMEHGPNIFMSFDKYLFLKVINIWTEAFGHIGFDAKQEIKPYYNIVHKAFHVAILKKLGQLFSRWSHPCEL